MRSDEEPDSGPTQLKVVIIQFKLMRRFFFPFFFGEISKLITGSLSRYLSLLRAEADCFIHQ